MTKAIRFAVLIAAVAVAGSGLAQRAGASTTDLARGAYLTGGAGQCADCHREGLHGGPNLVAGPPHAPWAKVVPSLRGLAMFKTDAEAIAFLETGKLPGGRTALGPMPGYRFNAADARAIVAYLRSLK